MKKVFNFVCGEDAFKDAFLQDQLKVCYAFDYAIENNIPIKIELNGSPIDEPKEDNGKISMGTYVDRTSIFRDDPEIVKEIKRLYDKGDNMMYIAFKCGVDPEILKEYISQTHPESELRQKVLNKYKARKRENI